MAFSRKGLTLSLGLISETVRLSGALDTSAEPDLKTVCVGQDGTKHAATAVTQHYKCAACGPIEDRTTLKKGRPSGDGFAVVEADAIKELKEDTSAQFKKQVALTAHPSAQVLNNTITTGKLYYLEPEGSGERFAVIRNLIASHPEFAFVAQYTVTSRVSMYVARVKGDAIILEAREQVNLVEPPSVEATPNSAMYELAEELLDRIVEDFDASTYEDTYTTRLAEMLDAAEVVDGASTPVAGTKPAKASADDALMEALKAQLSTKPKAKKKAS